MKYSNSQKIAGELAARSLSEKAWKFYQESEPLTVYEYTEDDQTLYAIDIFSESHDGLTFEELDKFLCDFSDAINAEDE